MHCEYVTFSLYFNFRLLYTYILDSDAHYHIRIINRHSLNIVFIQSDCFSSFASLYSLVSNLSQTRITLPQKGLTALETYQLFVVDKVCCFFFSYSFFRCIDNGRAGRPTIGLARGLMTSPVMRFRARVGWPTPEIGKDFSAYAARRSCIC